MYLNEAIQLEARKELARRFFYDYCRLMHPKQPTSSVLWTTSSSTATCT